uniref:phytol kinase n=1 Tax=Tetradesmus obliquus TaxID=3088 RepID=A0A383WBX8_TETOB|eukprot:jgi/Sobl393_1/11082/SZX74589.1
MQAAGQAQGQAGVRRAADKAETAASCFPAAVPSIMQSCLGTLAGSLAAAAAATAAAGGDGGSMFSQQQHRASAALLAVLLGRSLVTMADAQEAAAAGAGSTTAQLFARCLIVKPSFKEQWRRTGSTTSPGSTGSRASAAAAAEPDSTDADHEWGSIQPAVSRGATVHGLWRGWQAALLQVFGQLHVALRQLGLTAAAAAAAAAAASAEPAAGGPASSSSREGLAGGGSGEAADTSAEHDTGINSNRSSSGTTAGRQPKWSYLLQLHGCDRWGAAARTFEQRWPDVLAAINSSSSSSSSIAAGSDARSPSEPGSSSSSDVFGAGSQQQPADVDELYADALQLCRALVAAAPLPLVCNNPGCANMCGLSEAAAASKLCAGCRCRYCSAACQSADWKRHRRACKRMAAAGQTCSCGAMSVDVGVRAAA